VCVWVQSAFNEKKQAVTQKAGRYGSVDEIGSSAKLEPERSTWSREAFHFTLPWVS